jgi:hypothetical protein
MVVMLSSPIEFEGGSIEFKDDDADETRYETYNLSKGDVISWRGWTWHLVRPVTSGQRDVLVIEFWTNTDCTESGESRGGDTLESLQHVIAIDTSSSVLRSMLGAKICKRLPCESESEAEDAEAAYREGVSLAPSNPRRLKSLAYFIVGGSYLQQWQAFQYLSQACHLEYLETSDRFACLGLPCLVWALGATLLHTTFPPANDGAEDKEEVDPVALRADIDSQVFKLVVGAISCFALWMVIRQMEKSTPKVIRKVEKPNGKKVKSK